MRKFFNNLISFIVMVSLFLAMIPVSSLSTALAEGTSLPIDNFTNDYSDEDLYPVYNNLNDNQKNAYKIIVENIENGVNDFNFASKTDGKALTNDEYIEVLDGVYREHPEFFWYGSINDETVSYANGSRAYYAKDGTVMFYGANLIFNEYADDLENTKAEFDSIIDEIMAPTKNMSDGEKAYYLHNKVCELVSYDYNGIEEKKLDATVYGTLTKGVAVCQGYARTLQYLYRNIGIPAHIVSGKAAIGLEMVGEDIMLTDWESHAWMVVKLDGDYYNIDITWDDVHNEQQVANEYSFIGYNYFLIDDDYEIKTMINLSQTSIKEVSVPFSASHVRSKDSEFLPKATTTPSLEELVGISREQAYIDNFDRTYIDGVVTSEDDYIAFDMKGVFEGSLGDVSFTTDSEGKVTNVTGEKKEAGWRLYNTSEAANIRQKDGSRIPWKYFKSIVESNTQTFILTGSDLFATVIKYDRNHLIQSVYLPNIGHKGSISSLRTIRYYEFQNGCYLLKMNPDVFYQLEDTIAKKPTVIDWAERQDTVEIDKGDKLNLSGIKVKVYYNDFTSKEVDASTLTVSGFDSSKIGYQDVTLTYTGEKDMLVNTVKLHVKVNDVLATYTLGDVNDDGQVNTDDAIRVLMHTQFPDDDKYSLNQKSDFNGDGQVNTDDAIRLLMHTQFPDDEKYNLVDSK